uniref:Uncharacterized protein n=1 Tax=Anguilla anguilla TaxID=7936 RepID=A0A0E9USN2_ANGAN
MTAQEFKYRYYAPAPTLAHLHFAFSPGVCLIKCFHLFELLFNPDLPCMGVIPD